MSLMAEYKLEREGKGTYEEERGFATYLIKGEECYIEDIFVKKEYRRSRVGDSIGNAVQEIAKKAGCKYLTGTVYPNVGDPTASTLALLYFGFKIMSADKNVIYFLKEL